MNARPRVPSVPLMPFLWWDAGPVVARPMLSRGEACSGPAPAAELSLRPYRVYAWGKTQCSRGLAGFVNPL
jgi:hypothetical protein